MAIFKQTSAVAWHVLYKVCGTRVLASSPLTSSLFAYRVSTVCHSFKAVTIQTTANDKPALFIFLSLHVLLVTRNNISPFVLLICLPLFPLLHRRWGQTWNSGATARHIFHISSILHLSLYTCGFPQACFSLSFSLFFSTLILSNVVKFQSEKPKLFRVLPANSFDWLTIKDYDWKCFCSRAFSVPTNRFHSVSPQPLW